MVFVCSICMNSLSTRPAELQAQVEIELTATKCGHIFHSICLTNWFDQQNVPARHCPNCNALVSDADTTIIRPSGDGQNEADEDRLRQEASRTAEQYQILQVETNQIHALLIESMDNLKIETTQNDLLSREIEKLETQIAKLRQEHTETLELGKINEESFKTELTRLAREKKDLENDFGYAQGSSLRQKVDFENQLQSRNQRIIDLETNAAELRKSNEYWRQQHNRLRRRDGYVDGDDFMTNQYTQTENPEMDNLNERMYMFKKCMEHMNFEYKLLEKMTLQAASTGPCPLTSNSSNLKNGVKKEKTEPRTTSALKNGSQSQFSNTKENGQGKSYKPEKCNGKMINGNGNLKPCNDTISNDSEEGQRKPQIQQGHLGFYPGVNGDEQQFCLPQWLENVSSPQDILPFVLPFENNSELRDVYLQRLSGTNRTEEVDNFDFLTPELNCFEPISSHSK